MSRPDGITGQEQPGWDRAQKTSYAMIFVSLLLAFALRVSLDGLADRVLRHPTAREMWRAFLSHPNIHSLVAIQFLAFTVLLIRFYLGSIRYYEYKSTRQGSSSVDGDLILVIVLFIGFYFSGKLVTTTELFYFGVWMLHVVDLAWFLKATTGELLQGAMQKVGSWYVLFDIVTVLVMGVFAAMALTAGNGYLWCQWAMLVTLIGVSTWDFVKLGPFYKNAQDWESVLARPKIAGSIQ